MINISLYDAELLTCFKSNSQKARVLTEKWISSQMYCPCCLNNRLSSYPNNQRAYDFFCEKCGNNFQLKSTKNPFGNKIIDGEFKTMYSVIKSGKAPNFFILHYSSENWLVKTLILIPSFFFTLSVLEQRKALSKNAKRAGWQGCNFLLERLPNEGKIPIIKEKMIEDKNKVNRIWKKMSFLANKKLDFRGWTSDILKVVQKQNQIFSISDIYKWEKFLKRLHPENNNIKAKIRQQLQTLRDNNIINFKDKGLYELLD